jgi:hypothetical protein
MSKIKHPLPNENARCLGSNCEKKQDCARYLTIEIDTKDFMWHMDVKKELKEIDCTLFIDWRNNNYYEN